MCWDNSVTYDFRSCSFVTRDTSKNECFIFYGIFKSLVIFENNSNIKYKFGSRNFWATRYYVSTVGLNEAHKELEQENGDKNIIFIN